MTDDAINALREARLANIGIFAELARLADNHAFVPRDPAAPDVTLEIMVAALERSPYAARALIRRVLANDRLVIEAAEALIGDGPALALRRLDPDRDEACTFAWANDPVERAMAWSPEPIMSYDHHAWIRSPMRNAWIVELAGTPIGLVRVEGEDDEVSITIDAEFRGRGHGTAALRLIQAEHRAPMTAVTRVENHASRSAFERAGFVLQGVASGAAYYRWKPSTKRRSADFVQPLPAIWDDRS